MPRITEGQYALGTLTVFAVWLFVVLPLLYYPRQEAPQHDQQPAQSQQQPENIGDEPPSLIALKLFTSAGRHEIAAYCAPASKVEKQDWARNYVCDIKITDAYIAFFNCLLVLVTIGLIGVGSVTIWKMRDTEERQLRAYVFAEAKSFQRGIARAGAGIVPPTQQWRYEIKFMNSGQTPAYEFTQFTFSDVFDEPVSEADFVPSGPEKPISKAPLPPGHAVNTHGTHPVSAADAGDISAGRKGFYVFGEIRYIDAFKRQRAVTFRFVHNQHAGPNVLMYSDTGNGEI
jgi:hypothetical protein